MESIFVGFKTTAPVFAQLGEGKHDVYLTKFAETNSFANADGTVKEQEREWKDPTKQAVYTVYSPSKKAYFTGRLQFDSFRLSEGITEKEIKSGKYDHSSRYIVDTKTGCRLIDAERKLKALSIVNEFLNAIGVPEGTEDDQIMIEIMKSIADKTMWTIELVNKPYGKDDTDQIRAKNFRKMKAHANVADFE